MKRVKPFMTTTLLLFSLLSFTFGNTISAYASTAPQGKSSQQKTASIIPIYQRQTGNLMRGITPGAYTMSLQQKLAYRVRISGKNSIQPVSGKNSVLPDCVPVGDTCVGGIPASWTLTEYSDIVGEPYAYSVSGLQGSTDVNGTWYTDGHMWYLCGPGASTVALRYWVNTDTMGRQTSSDGTARLTWDNGNERSYLMYIATQSYPASFHASGSPGEETYNDPNYCGPSGDCTSFGDLANVLNWESSGHTSSSNYSQYGNGFYLVVGYQDLNLNVLQTDVVGDIYNARVPLVASVNDQYLPDWGGSQYAGTSHFVTILGYNQTNGTFTYAETCGKNLAGCDTSGFNYYTVSQQQMFNAIENDGINGGIVW